MKQKLANLIDLKSIITLLIGSVFCYLSVKGAVDVNNFMTIVVMVFTFYFAKKDGVIDGSK